MTHTILTPRGERITTVLPTYKHFVHERIEDSDAGWGERALAVPVTCEVHLGAGACAHGWEYEGVAEMPDAEV